MRKLSMEIERDEPQGTSQFDFLIILCVTIILKVINIPFVDIKALYKY